jgi:hypothetical protein
MMPIRYWRIFSESTAPLAWRTARAVRSGAQPGRDDEVERYVLPGERLVATPIPKVGSTTIKDIFAALTPGGRATEVRCKPSDVRARFPKSFVFSFVRNPWSRIHSCWKDKIDDAVSPGKIVIISRFPGLRPFMPFEEFVEWLLTENGGDDRADRHWLSQTAHLSDPRGGLICDFVGKIESFEEGMRGIESRTGVQLPRIAARNVKAGGGTAYLDDYSPRARKLIEERYGADIETFGYRFG